MKQKIKIILLFFCLNAAMIPFHLTGEPEKTAGGETSVTAMEVLPVPHPFYDSQILNDALKNGKIEKGKILVVLKTLVKYSKDADFKKEVDAQSALSEDFVKGLQGKLDEFKNPFLENYIAALERSLGEYVVAVSKQAEGLEKAYAPAATTEAAAAPLPAKTGLFSPSMLVEALSSFIAERFKDELASTFLEKFKHRLDEVKESGWGLLFPATTSFLTNVDVYNFKVFIASLKDVFRQDLNTIDLNLIEYLKKKRDQLANSKGSESSGNLRKGISIKIELPKDEKLLNFSIFVLELVHDVRTGEHPAEIINTLSQSEYIEEIEEKFAMPIRLLAMVSRVLVNRNGDGWVKPAEFKILLNDANEEMRVLFIGLIYALEKDEMDKITFGGKSLKDILAESADKITAINEYMHRLTVIAEEIEVQIKKLKNREKIGFEEYNAYLDIVYKMVDLGFDIKAFAGYDRNDKIVKEYLGYARNILEITQNIYVKNYSIAIVNTMDLLEAILPEDSKTVKEVLKYGTFMISMINAETADDMEKILEDAAMPVGGYRVVRSSPFSISLTTYPGFFGSREILTTNDQILGEKDEWNASFAAPIGLAFSLGRGNYDKPGPSWTVFLSVIDLGAPVSWRLGGEDEGIPDISWKNIFAPGAFIIYGLKNSPFSLGLGIQYGPQLREIKAPDEAVIESAAFRVGVLIAVEVPIFNFYAKGK
jgi:hypothetical protein